MCFLDGSATHQPKRERSRPEQICRNNKEIFSQERIMDIPNQCIVCYNFITPGQSVLFHCECVIAMCQSCSFAQIRAQHFTYLRGLTCPSCRLSSYNISGIEKCQIEERKLIQSATVFFSRNLSKGEPSTKQLLKRAIQMGYKSSIRLEDLDVEGVNLGIPIEASMVRLELALLESRRLTPEIQDDVRLLNPLCHLKISKNIFLEAAIELSQKLRSDPQENSDGSALQTEEDDHSLPGDAQISRQTSAVLRDRNEQLVEDRAPRAKQLCVCGDEEEGLYVQCTVGTGGCNGWVHPECIPQLRGQIVSLQSLVPLIPHRDDKGESRSAPRLCLSSLRVQT
jgi:hypothetical protein